MFSNFGVFLLILVTAIGGRPKPELCSLPGRLRWTLLPKEHYGNSLSGRGSKTQPSNWEADTLPLSYMYIFLLAIFTGACRVVAKHMSSPITWWIPVRGGCKHSNRGEHQPQNDLSYC